MRSITWRLTLWYSLILALIMLISGTVAFFSMQHLLLRRGAIEDTQRAVVAIQRQAAFISQNNGDNARGRDENGPKYIDLEEHDLLETADNGVLWIEIKGPHGQVLQKSQTLGSMRLNSSYIGQPRVTEINHHRALIAGVRLPGSVTAQVVRPLNREDIFLEKLVNVLGLLAIGGLLMALAGEYFIIRLVLRPIHGLIATARQISTTDLGQRIKLPPAKDELFMLGETFNNMLDRLEQGFRSQEEFVAAASHDLRTPLTVIKSYNNLLARWGKADPKVVEESVQATGRAVKTMERLVNDLLLLARVQSKLPLAFAPLPLAELLEEIVQEARTIAGEMNVSLEVKKDLTANADGYYLRRALWALIDNAIKYNRPGEPVRISLKEQGHEARIDVTDCGPGIEEKELTKIFERFYRQDRARSQGAVSALVFPWLKM